MISQQIECRSKGGSEYILVSQTGPRLELQKCETMPLVSLIISLEENIVVVFFSFKNYVIM